MAKVEIDLSEYDMMREAKANAEKRVEELTKENEMLKGNNTKCVVVRNRYYVPVMKRDIIRGVLTNLSDYDRRELSDAISRYYRRDGDQDTEKELARVIFAKIYTYWDNFLDHKSKYREEEVFSEVRGYEEMADEVRRTYEEQYKHSFEAKQKELDAAISSYNSKKFDVDNAVAKERESLTKMHNVRVKELEDKIKSLEEENRELSKSNAEKLEEALRKLREAEAEVAKYSAPKRKFLGLF